MSEPEDLRDAYGIIASEAHCHQDPCPIDARILAAWEKRAIGLGSHSHAELGQMVAWLARRLVVSEQRNEDLLRQIRELEGRVDMLDGRDP